MQLFKNCINVSLSLLTNITTILLTLMVLNVFLLVLMRYLFSFSFSWSEELTRYLMIWMGLLASSVLIKKRDHIRMKFFLEKLPDIYNKSIQVFFYLVEILFLLLLINKSWVWAFSMKTVISPAMQMSMFWVALAIPVSAFFMLLYSFKNAAEDIIHIFRKNKN